MWLKIWFKGELFPFGCCLIYKKLVSLHLETKKTDCLHLLMIKKLAIFCLVAVGLVMASCNEKSGEDNSIYVLSSVAVRSFSLASNDKVLNNLDSVYFSVDLMNAKIFNADSLPIHTRINRLVVNISTVGSSVAELTFRKDNDRDTTVNYLENSTDSINFANGPVKLHLVSLDGSVSRDYEIKVNVHKMKPDSLYWNRHSRRNLPSSFRIPYEQKTVRFGKQILTLTSNGSGDYCMAYQTDPAAGADREVSISFGFTPDVTSFSSTDDMLYVLDNEGNLYSSTDGESWQSADSGWFALLGGLENELLGVKRSGNDYFTCGYPSMKKAPAPESFPVKGASQLVTYATEWSKYPVSVMVGGADKDGKLNGYTWCYNNGQWAVVSKKPITPAEGYSLFAYDYVRTDTVNWSPVSNPVIIAVGGMTADRSFNRETFMSYDLGYNWFKAPSLMKLPDYIPGMRDAQCMVVNGEVKSRGADAWEQFPSAPLPWWLIIDSGVDSRAIAPITQWEVPYIYMYGGYNENGALYNTVWRGVINRLSFKPIQ